MNQWRLYAELSAAGLGFLAAVIIGILTGQWLDGHFGTGGLLTVTLLFVGVLGAVVNLMRILKQIDSSETRK